MDDIREAPDKHLIIKNHVAIDKNCIFWLGKINEESGIIQLGKSVYIGPSSFLGSCHKLDIGDYSLIGANSYIITVNHRTDRVDVPYLRQGYEGSDVTIGSNVWLGCHVTVLPGVTIGDNAIVGAGAVVTKSIPASETWAGVPARRIK